MVATAIAWTAAVVLGTAVVLLTEVTATSALGGSVFGVGLALLLTGNEYLQRLSTLGSSRWGISVGRHRTETRDAYPAMQLSPFGLALLVGLPMVLVGLSWMS